MRRDEAHADSNNYVYLIGADRLSTDLHNICLAANDKYTQLNLDFKYNDPWILIISMSAQIIIISRRMEFPPSSF
jgi:hypothetical protein